MKRKLYELALWYIGKCNNKQNSPDTEACVKSLKRLTYRCTDGKAYLKYGNTREWEKCTRFYVIDNAIQKLADYEDVEESVM